MKRIAEGLYVPAIQGTFGQGGIDALKHLLDTLTQIYRRVDPSSLSEKVVVFSQPAALLDASFTPDLVVSGPSQVSNELNRSCVVEARASGELAISYAETELAALSEKAVVYEFNRKVERIVVNGQFFIIINPSPVHASVFARPTFNSLTDALLNYRKRVASETSCLILQQVWGDSNRVYLKRKPEMTMRQSLNQFLSHVLQDAEVRPEQVVDETHPVDIKVTWSLTEQRAIIEIKWLGDSVGGGGEPGTKYRDGRAKDGAKQLADYLDASNQWAPTMRTRGYLVVFDARRRGLPEMKGGRTDAMHYENREITYDPDYSTSRDDFEPPLRLFMNPICT
ncbi:hypothetical protein PCC82_00925 [Agrobacterium deltaense]